LRAAASAADDFGLWLEKRQEFDDVRVLTDRDPQKLVTAKMVDVVRDLLDSGPTQLVVYFSCHGLLKASRRSGSFHVLQKIPTKPST
jgi:hypothetical protein